MEKKIIGPWVKVGVALCGGLHHLFRAQFDSAIQFETGVIHNSLKSLTFFDEESPADGDLYQVPFLVDFLYSFHPGPRLTPYVGVGGGGVYMRMHLQNFAGFLFDTDSSETD